jgi:hypothetical protein
MIGEVDSYETVAFIPKTFAIAADASELITDKVDPKLYNSSEGGGVRKARNSIGKTVWRSVCRLKSIRIKPVTKIGIVRIWYSSGVKVYVLCQ